MNERADTLDIAEEGRAISDEEERWDDRTDRVYLLRCPVRTPSAKPTIPAPMRALLLPLYHQPNPVSSAVVPFPFPLPASPPILGASGQPGAACAPLGKQMPALAAPVQHRRGGGRFFPTFNPPTENKIIRGAQAAEGKEEERIGLMRVSELDPRRR